MVVGTTKYDGCFYFRLAERAVYTTKEVVSDVCYLDLDRDGEPVGIEIIGFPLPVADRGLDEEPHSYLRPPLASPVL